MILIDNVKYACMECIRGHRSSLCRHHQRPLLQVRSKGRPNVGFGNKNHRIAVFAEEIATSSSSDPDYPCKNLPVVILKASDKQVIDLLNGQIVGPYNDAASTSYCPSPLISGDSFINASSCCARPPSKVTKLCSCNKKGVSKSRILKTYLGKRNLSLNGQSEPSRPQPTPAQHSCCSKDSISVDDSLFKSTDLLFSNGQHNNKNPLPEHTLSGVPTSNGSTSSDSSSLSHLSTSSTLESSNMSLFDPVFGPKPTADASKNLNNATAYSHAYANSNPFYSSQQQSRYLMTQGNKGEVFEMVNVQPCSILGSCACASDCDCPGCEEHKNTSTLPPQMDQLRNDAQYDSNLILSLNDPPQPDFEVPQLPRPASAEKDSDSYTNFLQQMIKMCSDTQNDEDKSFKPEQSTVCKCPDDNCQCTNCETHGIIDGYKLDELFKTKVPAEFPLRP